MTDRLLCWYGNLPFSSGTSRAASTTSRPTPREPLTSCVLLRCPLPPDIPLLALDRLWEVTDGYVLIDTHGPSHPFTLNLCLPALRHCDQHEPVLDRVA
jgi:hypothetical protein